MAVSATDKELLRYFTQMDELQKKSLLELIRSFLRSNNVAAAGVTIEQYNVELDAAMESIGRGEFVTLEELEMEMKSW